MKPSTQSAHSGWAQTVSKIYSQDLCPKEALKTLPHQTHSAWFPHDAEVLASPSGSSSQTQQREKYFQAVKDLQVF